MKPPKVNYKTDTNIVLVARGKTRPLRTYVRDGQRFVISPFTGKEEVFTPYEFTVESKKARTRISTRGVAV